MGRDYKRFFKLASLCYTLFYTVVIFFLMAITYASLKIGSETILTVREDWLQMPFTQLLPVKADPKLRSSAQKCPEGFELALDQVWRGTDYGCDCNKKGRDFSNANIYEGMCTYNETLAGCQPVMPLSPRQITILDGYVICGRKVQMENFFEL